jgi:hypothetical protein
MRVCRAIRLLADGWNIEDVAREVRVRPVTLELWQQDAEFHGLLDCLRETGRLQNSLEVLSDLTPGAIAALRRALEGDDVKVAVQAAREVLDRVGLIRRQGVEQSSEQVIRVEYVNPEHQAVSTASWADRNPATSGALQSGRLREAIWEDRDGEDPAD